MNPTKPAPESWMAPQMLSGPGIPQPSSTIPTQRQDPSPRETQIQQRRTQPPVQFSQRSALPSFAPRPRAATIPFRQPPSIVNSLALSQKPSRPLDQLAIRLKTLYEASFHTLASRVHVELTGYTQALNHAQREAETMRAYCICLKKERDEARAKIARLTGSTTAPETAANVGSKRNRNEESETAPLPTTVITNPPIVPTHAPPLQFIQEYAYATPPSSTSSSTLKPLSDSPKTRTTGPARIPRVRVSSAYSRSRSPPSSASPSPSPTVEKHHDFNSPARSLSPLPVPLSAHFSQTSPSPRSRDKWSGQAQSQPQFFGGVESLERNSHRAAKRVRLSREFTGQGFGYSRSDCSSSSSGSPASRYGELYEDERNQEY